MVLKRRIQSNTFTPGRILSAEGTPRSQKRRSLFQISPYQSSLARFIVQTFASLITVLVVLLALFCIYRDKELKSYYIGQRPPNITEGFHESNLALINVLCRNLKKWHLLEPTNDQVARFYHETCDLSHIV